MFDELEDVDGKGGKKGSIFLRNVVKVEDIPDPIAVGEWLDITFIMSIVVNRCCLGASRGNIIEDAA